MGCCRSVLSPAACFKQCFPPHNKAPAAPGPQPAFPHTESGLAVLHAHAHTCLGLLMQDNHLNGPLVPMPNAAYPGLPFLPAQPQQGVAAVFRLRRRGYNRTATPDALPYHRRALQSALRHSGETPSGRLHVGPHLRGGCMALCGWEDCLPRGVPGSRPAPALRLVL